MPGTRHKHWHIVVQTMTQCVMSAGIVLSSIYCIRIVLHRSVPESIQRSDKMADVVRALNRCRIWWDCRIPTWQLWYASSRGLCLEREGWWVRARSCASVLRPATVRALPSGTITNSEESFLNYGLRHGTWSAKHCAKTNIQFGGRQEGNNGWSFLSILVRRPCYGGAPGRKNGSHFGGVEVVGIFVVAARSLHSTSCTHVLQRYSLMSTY